MFGDSGYRINGLQSAQGSRLVGNTATRRTLWTVLVAGLIGAAIAIGDLSPVVLPTAGEGILSGAVGGGSRPV